MLDNMRGLRLGLGAMDWGRIGTRWDAVVCSVRQRLRLMLLDTGMVLKCAKPVARSPKTTKVLGLLSRGERVEWGTIRLGHDMYDVVPLRDQHTLSLLYHTQYPHPRHQASPTLRNVLQFASFADGRLRVQVGLSETMATSIPV